MENFNRNRKNKSKGNYSKFEKRDMARSDSRPRERRGSSTLEMHEVTCDKCGSRCEVPFKPSSNKPVYCRDCFRLENNMADSRERPYERRDSGRSRGDFKERQMHDAVCDKCGNDCKVPFRPTEGKPIYCSDCFREKEESSSQENEEGPIDTYAEDIALINAKLDKIMKALNIN